MHAMQVRQTCTQPRRERRGPDAEWTRRDTRASCEHMHQAGCETERRRGASGSLEMRSWIELGTTHEWDELATADVRYSKLSIVWMLRCEHVAGNGSGC